MLIYKIQDKNTKLYSTGGTSPHWSSKGKVWSSLGSLKNHLNIVDTTKYVNAEVIEYILEEVDSYSAKSVIRTIESANKEKDAKRKAKLEKVREARELKELARLKEKYKEVD